MQYLKRNTKYGIFAFFVIVLSITISISTLAKTEVYLSPYDNPQILSNDSPKQKVQTININTSSQDELIEILKISESLVRRIINPREELGGLKDPKTFTQLPELTILDWREWKGEGIKISIWYK